MGTILRDENRGAFTKTAARVASLAPSTITIGGGQFVTDVAISVNLDTTGTGGLDTGSPTASTLYFVYAVRDSSLTSLVASLSSSAPAGFSQYVRVGQIYTDGSSDINATAGADTASLFARGGSGHGSTNTWVRKYTEIERLFGEGVHFTLTNNSTEGTIITIITPGSYAFHASDRRNAGTWGSSVVVNASSLNTGGGTGISVGTVNVTTTMAGAFGGVITLTTGDYVIVKNDPTVDGTSLGEVHFDMAKLD